MPATRPTAAPAGNVQVSKTANGIWIASADRGGAAASVGVFVKAGSRYEAVPGTSHLLQSLALGSTHVRSAAKVARDVEDMGARLSAHNGREVFAYKGAVLRRGVGDLLAVVGDAIKAPRLVDYAVKEAAEALAPLAADLRAEPSVALMENVHAAGFGASSPLGRSIYASPEDLEAGAVTAETLTHFLGARFTGRNIVVAASNVDHESLAKAVEMHFAGINEGVPDTAAAAPASPFLGGECHVRTTAGGAAHVAVALAAPSARAGSAGAHVLGVLQALLGASAPRSVVAGAPRVSPASHARIPRSLHNDAHSFIAQLGAFATPYADAGVLGLAGAAGDHEAGRLVDAMAGFLKDAAALPVSDAELARAKAQYKLRIASAAETAGGARDYMGAQLLGSGSVASVADTLKAVDGVTAANVQALAKEALSSKPAIAAIGDRKSVV